MNNPKWIAALLVASLAAGGLTVPAAAAEAPTLKRIVKDEALRVGMSGMQAPLHMKDRSGELMGLEVDLAELLAATFEVNLRIIEKPFAELLPALKAGEIDLIISGMSITPERTVNVTFVGPYVMSGTSLVTKSALLARAVDASDLDQEELKLAVLGNSTSLAFVKKHLPRAQVVTVKNYDEAVNLVRQDEVDAMVADMPACVLAAARYADEGLETLAQPLTIEPIGIAIRANDPQLKNLLENYLTAIKEMGLLQVLKNKWFADDSWISSLP